MNSKEKGASVNNHFTPQMPYGCKGKDTAKIRYIKPVSVKKLEQAVLERQKKRYPNFPHHVKRTFRDDTANGLTRCITTYLELKGCQAERINSTGRYIDQSKVITDAIGIQRRIGSGKWVYGSGTKGTADISATIAGKSVKIEVKIGRDKQSEAQREYQRQVESAGGVYVIAHDFTSFVSWYHSKFGGYGNR